MKSSSPTNTRLTHLRSLLGRFAFAALVLASFGLMLLGKAEVVVVERLRMALADSLVPVMDVLSRPAAAVSGVVENVRELAAVREENTRLREENAMLLRWQTVARLLEAENDSLKELLRYTPPPGMSYVSARVVADTGGAYVQSLLITAGTRETVQKGQAVLSGEGLVGRVSEVGYRSARVLLVTDINSRIPVSVGNARQKAILSGDNSDRPKLLFLKSASSVVPGDRVMTSGDSGVFPPGLPVGVVASVEEGAVRVEPLLQRDRLEYVRVVDFGLKGILDDISDSPAKSSSGAR